MTHEQHQAEKRRQEAASEGMRRFYRDPVKVAELRAKQKAATDRARAAGLLTRKRGAR